MKTSIISILGAGLLCAAAWADRGSIPYDFDATIFEPNQRAFIAWNGTEEILLLSTNLYASKPTKVLEVLPLPAEPTVNRADTALFKKAVDLINSKLKNPAEGDWQGGRGGGALRAEAAPAGEITFHEKIGAHDISVAHVKSPDGFVEWAEDYLIKSGVKQPKIPDVLKRTVREYIGEGLLWFVFDVVELETVPKSNDAVSYRFATDKLFYPMKISRTDKGWTSVDLLVCTRKGVKPVSGDKADLLAVDLKHIPVKVTPQELTGIDPAVGALMGSGGDCVLRIWNVSGNLETFDRDLWWK